MDQDVSVYQCCFETYIDKATVLIKFPCIFFLEWKTANSKKLVEGQTHSSAGNNEVDFQETL